MLRSRKTQQEQSARPAETKSRGETGVDREADDTRQSVVVSSPVGEMHREVTSHEKRLDYLGQVLAETQMTVAGAGKRIDELVAQFGGLKEVLHLNSPRREKLLADRPTVAFQQQMEWFVKQHVGEGTPGATAEERTRLRQLHDQVTELRKRVDAMAAGGVAADGRGMPAISVGELATVSDQVQQLNDRMGFMENWRNNQVDRHIARAVAPIQERLDSATKTVGELQETTRSSVSRESMNEVVELVSGLTVVLGELLNLQELAQFESFLPRLHTLALRLEKEFAPLAADRSAQSSALSDYGKRCADAAEAILREVELIREEVLLQPPEAAPGQQTGERLQALEARTQSLSAHQTARFQELRQEKMSGLIRHLGESLLRPLFHYRRAAASPEEEEALRHFEERLSLACDLEIQLRLVAPEEGDPFEPDRMEAVADGKRLVDEQKRGRVAEVVEPGYEWYGETLQPAKVDQYA